MPPEIEIKILRPGDDLILANVAPQLFDNPIDPGLAKEFLADSRHHIAVALDPSIVRSMRDSHPPVAHLSEQVCDDSL